MTRTQGWDGPVSHFDELEYAVDWDDGSGNWVARAANGGVASCNPDTDLVQPTFGNYVGIYNAIAGQMSVYLHLNECGVFEPGMDFDVTQGQPLVPIDNTGTSEGDHLHFHVVAGDDLEGVHTAIPFAMSNLDAFPYEEDPFPTDGPSDNAGVGYDSSGTLDSGIRNAYLAEGGASASWWNVGASYRSTNESNDEWGGPCRNTTTPFVHVCTSNWGSGLMATQNYLSWLGVRHSVMRTNAAGHVFGQIQGSLSNLYFGQPLARSMGAPTGFEADGLQQFQAGYMQRNNGQGVRIDAYFCIGPCQLLAILHYDAYGVFCPSLNNDRSVNAGDQLLLGIAIQQMNYVLAYDLNVDGALNAGDQLLLGSRVGMQNCAVVDPDID